MNQRRKAIKIITLFTHQLISSGDTPFLAANIRSEAFQYKQALSEGNYIKIGKKAKSAKYVWHSQIIEKPCTLRTVIGARLGNDNPA